MGNKSVSNAKEDGQILDNDAGLHRNDALIDREAIKPSKYRDVGWDKEMERQQLQSIRPTSYIDEFRHPQNAEKNDWSNILHANGHVKNPESNDLINFKENKRHRI